MIIHVNGKNVRDIDTSVKKKRTPRKKKKGKPMLQLTPALDRGGVSVYIGT